MLSSAGLARGKGAAGGVEYEIRDQRLLIEGEPVSLFSGSLRYWRIRPDLWRPILERIKGMGFGVVETCMPWSVHEVTPGKYDFGATDGRLDLGRFMDACLGSGVRLLARPGPRVGAGITYEGYPERILADEGLLARCADGSTVAVPSFPMMFPAPCYHHPRFQEQVRNYFEALAGAVGGRAAVYPEGPIIAIRADGGHTKSMRANPFDWDYSEHAVRLYREWLRSRYGALADLNEAYRSGYSAWQLVDPPRTPALAGGDTRKVLDWTEFSEYYTSESVRRVAVMLRELFGDGVPVFDSYPVAFPLHPLDLSGAESFLEFQGMDSRPGKSDYYSFRAGVKYASTMSRLPVMVDSASGVPHRAPPHTPDEVEFATRAALMHGMKGVNCRVAVEPEAWYGAPVERDGAVRLRYPDLFTGLLGEIRAWRLEDMSCERQVLLLASREYERLASAASIAGPVSGLVSRFAGFFESQADLLISSEELGLGEPVAARYARLLAFWYWALTASAAHFAIGDTSAGADVLSRYGMVIVPTFEFMERVTQKRLLDYTEAGGTLVVGPRAPLMDERMQQCDTLASRMREPEEVLTDTAVFGVDVEEASMFGPGAGSMTYRCDVGSGRLIHVGMVPMALRSVRDAAPFVPMLDTLMRLGGIEPAFVPGDGRVDVSVWRGEGGTVLFVANPTQDLIETSIGYIGGAVFEDSRTGKLYGGNDSFRIEMKPRTVIMLGTMR